MLFSLQSMPQRKRCGARRRAIAIACGCLCPTALLPHSVIRITHSNPDLTRCGQCPRTNRAAAHRRGLQCALTSPAALCALCAAAFCVSSTPIAVANMYCRECWNESEGTTTQHTQAQQQHSASGRFSLRCSPLRTQPRFECGVRAAKAEQHGRAKKRRRYTMTAIPLDSTRFSRYSRVRPTRFRCGCLTRGSAVLLCSMRRRLRHRGPDWSGVHVHKNSGQTHTENIANQYSRLDSAVCSFSVLTLSRVQCSLTSAWRSSTWKTVHSH